MNPSDEPLHYGDVAAAYQHRFGVRPPADLLKSVSLLGLTPMLSQAIHDATQQGAPLDFDAFAERFFEGQAEPRAD